MPRDSRFPDLGLYFGDQGGPGTALPHTDSQRSCPFLDDKIGEFCALDGAMCPFVGFNHRKCKKYTNNVAKGALSANGIAPENPLLPTKAGKPPRLEALTEGKKGGSKVSAAQQKVADKIDADADNFADLDREFFDKEANARAHAQSIRAEIKKRIDAAARNVQGKDPRVPKKGATKPKPPAKPKSKPKAKAVSGSKPAASEPVLSKKEIADIDTWAGVFDALETMNGHDLTSDIGRTNAEIAIQGLQQNRMLRGTKHPEAIRKAKEIAKARGERDYEKEQKDYNKKAREFVLHHLHGDEGVDVDDGGYQERLAFINQFFNIANEMVDKEETHPGEFNTRIHSQMRLDPAGNTSSDDETLAIFGNTHAQGEVGPKDDTPSAVSNEPPATGPHYTGFTPVKSTKTAGAPSLKHKFAPPKGKVGWDYSKPAGERVPDGIPDPTPPWERKTKPESEKPTPEKAKKPRTPNKGRKRVTMKVGGTGSGTRHALPQATTKVRRPEQLDAWFRTLSVNDHRLIFKGARGHKGPSDAVRKAYDLMAQDSPADIAKMHKFYAERLEAGRKHEHDKIIFERDFQENLRRLKAMGLIDDKMIRKVGRDPEHLDKVVKFQNKLLDNLFTVKAKKLNIGNSSVTQFLKDTSMPIMDRSDFEVIRMSEQMAMAAVRDQHRYGRKYGQFQTITSFFSDVVIPFIIAFLPLDREAKTLMLKSFQSLWPRGWLTKLYFSFIQKPLPTYRGSNAPVVAADTKFMASQKMSHPGQADKVMKGYYDDKAGVYSPPDRAVLHTRSYPTTKSTWGRTRNKALTKRYQASMNRESGGDWKRGFLRR